MKISRFMSVVSYLFLLHSEALSQQVGRINGGFETNAQYYMDDASINAEAPREKMASNNYLKLDYEYKNFTIGVRYEAYLPPLLGYPTSYRGRGIVNRYVRYTDEFMEITAGNFYEQFGSGLILRAYEERLLGIDNSIDGVNIKFAPLPFLRVKAVYGNQRAFFDVGGGIVRGLDTTLDIRELLGLGEGNGIEVGGSIVSKFESYTGPDDNVPENVDAFAGRINLGNSNLSLEAEYVSKSADPTIINNNSQLSGNALWINLGHVHGSFGTNLTFRRLENMDFRSERMASLTNLWINYIPSETKQHGYALANIYPYNPQSNGEIGGQMTVTYFLPRNSQIGGKYGTSVELNYSMFNTLKYPDQGVQGTENPAQFLAFGKEQLYRDFNIEISRKISPSLKTTVSYVQLSYNKEIVEGIPSDIVDSSIGIFEMLVKLPRRRSFRYELQHLWTTQDNKSWAALLLEYNLAPKWSFFFLDQYNYGADESVHYYNGGFSYVKSSTRMSLSYGRQRGGLLCVGGVCRFVPFASGISLSMSTSF